MSYSVGQQIAYSVGGDWFETTIARLTPTQAVLVNGKRFRLNDGYVIGINSGMVTRVKDPTNSEVAKQIETWKQRKKVSEEYRESKYRLMQAIERLEHFGRDGYCSGIPVDAMDEISASINTVLDRVKNGGEA